MKVILVMVMSVDGNITKGVEEKIYEWTSKEDQRYFLATLKKVGSLLWVKILIFQSVIN